MSLSITPKNWQTVIPPGGGMEPRPNPRETIPGLHRQKISQSPPRKSQEFIPSASILDCDWRVFTTSGPVETEDRLKANGIQNTTQ